MGIQSSGGPKEQEEKVQERKNDVSRRLSGQTGIKKRSKGRKGEEQEKEKEKGGA